MNLLNTINASVSLGYLTWELGRGMLGEKIEEKTSEEDIVISELEEKLKFYILKLTLLFQMLKY